MAEQSIVIKNKKAHHEYFLLQEFTAGIQLTGSEIKSIRDGKASIVDAYCSFFGNELFVRNMHIAEYTQASHYNHEPKRDRKLLLTKKELKKLLTRVKEKGSDNRSDSAFRQRARACQTHYRTGQGETFLR